MGGDEPTARQSVWTAAGMQPDPAESGRIYGLIHNPDPEPREPMRATPVDRYQSDVLIPDMGAGKYWYVDPRAGLAQRPAQQMAQGPTESGPGFFGAQSADAIQRMIDVGSGAYQSDLTYRPSSSQTTYDPMDEVNRRARYKEQVDQMYKVMGPKDVDKTVTMNIGGKEWEVPAVFDEMSDEDRNIVQYLPHTQWPKSLLMKIEDNARNELKQGNDPFGNSFRPPQTGF